MLHKVEKRLHGRFRMNGFARFSRKRRTPGSFDRFCSKDGTAVARDTGPGNSRSMLRDSGASFITRKGANRQSTQHRLPGNPKSQSQHSSSRLSEPPQGRGMMTCPPTGRSTRAARAAGRAEEGLHSTFQQKTEVDEDEIPIHKSQIPNKLQAPNSNNPNTDSAENDRI